MKGLLLKDFYTLNIAKKQFLLMAALALGFCLWSPSAGIYLIALMSVMGVSALMGTFNYDEKSSWDKFAVSLPLQRRTIVRSKYLFAGLCAAVPVLFAALCSLFSSLIHNPGTLFQTVFVNSGIAFCIGLFSITVTLPMVFWLGAAKARIASSTCYLVLFLAVFLVWQFWRPQATALLLRPHFLQAAGTTLVCGLLLLFFLSYFLSAALYKRQEL